jgi:HK97 gp10 family phage protein
MAQTFKIAGLRELENALGELPKSTGKNVLRRVAVKALTPMRDAARALAPNDPETAASIAETIIVTTKRPDGDKSDAARAFARGGIAAARAAGSGPVKAYMGPATRHPKVWQQEMGNVNHGPQPYMRPAYDEGRRPAIEAIKDDLWAEIDKAAKRLAKKRAKIG